MLLNVCKLTGINCSCAGIAVGLKLYCGLSCCSELYGEVGRIVWTVGLLRDIYLPSNCVIVSYQHFNFKLNWACDYSSTIVVCN